jgi:hypothetical protein
MTLKVVVDAKNRIIAVAHIPDVQVGQGPALIARPVLGHGQWEFDVVVPEAHVARKPREHMRALHVDAAGSVVYRAGKTP